MLILSDLGMKCNKKIRIVMAIEIHFFFDVKQIDLIHLGLRFAFITTNYSLLTISAISSGKSARKTSFCPVMGWVNSTLAQ